MDVGHFSSCAEAHVDLEAMMMQMEKLYDFPSEAPPPASSIMEFPMGTPLNPFINTLSATAPGSTIRTPPATALLTGVAAHQNLASVPSVQSNSASSHSETACDAGQLRRQQPAPMAAMREMAFHIAAMQPIHIDPESVRPPKRRNVRISKDPQSVAARHRRERISERIRILQRLVPGGTKMDTASMLDEAIHYVKFLKTQVQSLEKVAAGRNAGFGFGFGLSPAAAVSSTGFSCCLGSRSS